MQLLATLETVLRNPAWDTVLVLFFLLAGLIGGMLGNGRVKILSFILATYLSLFLSPIFFQLFDDNKFGRHTYRNLSFYVMLIVILFLLFDRSILRGEHFSYPWWQSFAASFLAVGLFMAGTLNLLSFHGIVKFSPLTLALFSENNAFIFWMVAPIVGLFLISRMR